MTPFRSLGDLGHTLATRIRALMDDETWTPIERTDEWLAYIHLGDERTLLVVDRTSQLEMTAWLNPDWSIAEYRLEHNGQLLDQAQYDATLIARITTQAQIFRDRAQARHQSKDEA